MSDLDTPEYERIYIAGNVSEAEAAEDLFAEQGIEYELEPAEFRHAITLGGVFAGVAFCVLAGQAEYCRAVLVERGFSKGIVQAEES